MEIDYKLLIIDDDENVLSILCQYFSKKEYTVLPASNGLDALNIIYSESSSIDLVITDLTLPLISGEDLIIIMKDRFPRIPIITISGSVDQPLVFSKKSKPDAMFEKPISMDLIEEKVKELLVGSQIQQNKCGRNCNIRAIIDEFEDIITPMNEDVLISEFSCSIKPYLEELKNGLLNLNVSVEALYGKVSKDGCMVSSRTLSALDECIDLTTALSNCYLLPVINFQYFDIGLLLDRYVNRILNDNKYILKKEVTHCEIKSDRYLVGQIFYTLLENVHDFLRYSPGELSIATEVAPPKTDRWRGDSFKLLLDFKIYNSRDDTPGYKPKIMIVDDDEQVADYIRKILENENYSVDIIESAYGFFSWCEKGETINYSLIIIDVLMKGMSGIEAINTFRKRRCFAHIPIITISVDPDINSIEFMQLMQNYHPVEILSKFSISSKLIKTVNSILKNKKTKKFNFTSLCSMSLCDSIANDHLMDMGFYPMERAIECINGKLRIESEGFEHRILLTVPNIKEESPTEWVAIQKEYPIAPGKSVLLNRMNRSARHDLNNKLNAILMEVTLDAGLGDDGLEILKEIKNSISQMNDSLQNIKIYGSRYDFKRQKNFGYR